MNQTLNQTVAQTPKPPQTADAASGSGLIIHHIGYLVKKMDAAIDSFLRLGYTVSRDTVYDSIRNIHICFMEKDGYTIELISPSASTSVAAGLMKKYKNSPYHICYETQDLDDMLARLTAGGYAAIDAPAPAPALDGRRVVFLVNPFLGMIELLEAC